MRTFVTLRGCCGVATLLSVLAFKGVGAVPTKTAGLPYLAGTIEGLPDHLLVTPALPATSHVERSRPGATRMRVHFKRDRESDPTGWSLAIRRESDAAVLWTASGGIETRSSFWSESVRADDIIIQLHRDTATSRAGFAVDAFIAYADRTQPYEYLHPEKLVESLAGQSPEIKTWAKSVCLIEIIRSKHSFYCTGFVLRSDLVVTNRHCAATDDEATNARFWFDFDSGTVGQASVAGAKCAFSDPAADLTLLRVSVPSSAPPLRLAETDVLGGPWLLLGHPQAAPLMVTRQKCGPLSGGVFAGDLTLRHEFGHSCDTDEGSSGSPIIDPGLRVVVGVHNGYRAFGAQEMNTGVRVGALRAAAAALDSSGSKCIARNAQEELSLLQ